MTASIRIEVPAEAAALPTVGMVLFGIGHRLDFTLDEIDDLRLAADELLRAVMLHERPERLRMEATVDDGRLLLHTGPLSSTRLRADLEPPAECFGLCLLLRRTVDRVEILEVADGYRVTLHKRHGGEP